MKTNFSIIIPAYKEENLDNLINLLLNQEFPNKFHFEKLVVVASGYGKALYFKDIRVVVIKEKTRKGKAHAINLGLKKTKNSDIIVVINADVVPAENALKELLKPFSSQDIGMTGGRPVPSNNESEFIGFVIHLVWNLHHLISLKKTKAGELIAFRNIIDEIDRYSPVDEASIEAEMHKKKYKIKYCPHAIVYLQGPKTFSDLIEQRKRIYIGHLRLKKLNKYEVSTMNTKMVISSLLCFMKSRPKNLFWIVLACLMEIYIRIMAAIDFYFFNQNPYKWGIIKTAKLT